jgi:hypothetical protein
MRNKIFFLEKRFERLAADRLAYGYSLKYLKKAVLDVLKNGSIDEESRRKLNDAVRKEIAGYGEYQTGRSDKEEDYVMFYSYIKGGFTASHCKVD